MTHLQSLVSELGLMRWQMAAAEYPFWHQTAHACDLACSRQKSIIRPPETPQEIEDTNKLSVPDNFYTYRPFHTDKIRRKIANGMRRYYGSLRRRKR